MKFSGKKVVFISILIICFISFGLIFIKNKKNDINILLNNKSYSYLPKEALNYIKKIYENTGELVFTEKNKQTGLPYLNPNFITYLTMSKDEQSKVDIIPDTYVTDYSINNNDTEGELPSKYDLRNLNGGNYISPMKDQGNLGLCWSFASIESAESYLMIKNNKPYDISSKIFSVRQMDYATSTDGINNYNNENGFRKLTSGGNFYMSSIIMSNGLSLVDGNKMPYDESTDKKELYEVLNYDNSIYDVDSTAIMPILYDDPIQSDVDGLVYRIKKLVMENGGAYVGTYSPQSGCGFISNGDSVIRVDRCRLNINTIGSGHAMQVIGWDDDYEYSYCKTSDGNVDSNNGSCTEGVLKSGKGAWILRNSWGLNEDIKEYHYVYLTYDSSYASFGFITSMSEMSKKNWDNNYHTNLWQNDVDENVNSEEQIFTKKINSGEKIDKIKFFPSTENSSYDIYVNSKLIKNVNTNYIGINTIDLSGENIILNDNTFEVKIIGLNDSLFLHDTISVFTSNTLEEPIIKSQDYVFDKLINASKQYEFILYQETKNIPSNTILSYSLFDGEEDISNYLSVENNYVAENNINVTISIDNSINPGKYILKTSYGSYSVDSYITINSNLLLDGDGTSKNPFIIKSENDLRSIRYSLNAYYKLNDDIVLTNDWVPIGTVDAPFTGSFDGNNHTISNIIVNNDYEYTGLFGYVLNNNEADKYIQSLTIKDSVVAGENNVGLLIGYIDNGNTYFSYHIDDISLSNSKVSSLNGNVGALIGYVNLNMRDLYVNRIYSSVKVIGGAYSGLIGYLTKNTEDYHNIVYSSILNVGTFETNDDIAKINNHGTLVGGVYYKNNVYNNMIGGGGIITTSIIKGNNYTVGHLFNYNLEYQSNYYGRYIKGIDDKYSYLVDGKFFNSANNDLIGVNSANLITADIFTNWMNNFSENWEVKTIDGIKRIPVLKNIDFEYTNVRDISIDIDETKSLLDYIKPYTEKYRLIYKVNDNEDKILVFDEDNDIKIKGIKSGETTIHLISNYDGYENDINIVIKNPNLKVNYYSNYDDNEMYSQITKSSEKFNLETNKFIRKGYIFKEWNTEKNGSGISYSNEQTILNGIKEDINLYAIWIPIKYTIIFDSNSGTGNMENQEIEYDKLVTLNANSYKKDGYYFKEWNTKSNGTGISYKNLEEVENLSNINGDKIYLYAIWAFIPNIINNTTNYECVYDGNEHSIKIDLNIDNYDIKYSINNKNYDLVELPKFKDVGEYTINYIVTSGDYIKIEFSNKVKIYGIKSIDKSIDVKNDILIVRYNDVDKLKNKFDIFAKIYDFKHIDKNGNIINNSIIKTSDKFNININGEKDYIYSLSLLGDVNGDGKINSMDYVKIRKHIMQTENISDKVYYYAADVNSDNKISSADYVKIKKYIMNGGTL